MGVAGRAAEIGFGWLVHLLAGHLGGDLGPHLVVFEGHVAQVHDRDAVGGSGGSAVGGALAGLTSVWPVGAFRPVGPDAADRLGQELERPSSPLEPRQRAEALVEAIDQGRVERVGGRHQIAVGGRVRGGRPGGDVRGVKAGVQLPVGLPGGGCGLFVDPIEQAAAQDEADLAVVGGAADGALGPVHHVFRLGGQPVRHRSEQLLLHLVGLPAVGVGAGGQGDHDAGRGRGGGRLEQRLQRGHGGVALGLDAVVGRRAELADVVGQLVDHDHGGGGADGLQPGLLAGGGAGLVGRLDAPPGPGAELAGDLAPQGVGGDGAGGEAVDGIEAEARHRRYLAALGIGQQGRVDELPDVGGPGASGQVPQGDQTVGLAAAEAGLVAVDGMLGCGRAGVGLAGGVGAGARGAGAGAGGREPGERAGQQLLEPFGGVGQGEERLGVGVGGVVVGVADHLVELGGEVLALQPAGEHVGSGLAGVGDRGQFCHRRRAFGGRADGSGQASVMRGRPAAPTLANGCDMACVGPGNRVR